MSFSALANVLHKHPTPMDRLRETIQEDNEEKTRAAQILIVALYIIHSQYHNQQMIQEIRHAPRLMV